MSSDLRKGFLNSSSWKDSIKEMIVSALQVEAAASPEEKVHIILGRV